MWIQNGRGDRVGICPSTLFLVYGGIHWDDFAYHLVFVLFGSQLCPRLFPTTKHLQICQLRVSCLSYSAAHKKHYCSGHPRTAETSMRLPWTCLSWLIAQIYLLFSCLIALGTSGVFPLLGNGSSDPFCSWFSNPIWRVHHSASTNSLLPMTLFRTKITVVSKLSNIVATSHVCSFKFKLVKYAKLIMLATSQVLRSHMCLMGVQFLF